MRIFTDDIQGAEHIVLTKGDISGPDPVLTRMHALNPLEDVLGITPAHAGELHGAMKLIAETGRGVVVLLRDTAMKLVMDDTAAPHTLRQYGVGAQILAALGLGAITLVTNSPTPRVVGLDAYGLTIAGACPIPQD